MKSARAFIVLIFGGIFFMSCSNEELFATTPVSEMQKLMAESIENQKALNEGRF